MLKRLSFIILAVLALISCENPVQAGLGSDVDINPPTLSNVSPAPGSFLKGDSAELKVEAKDDKSVAKVQFQFWKADETPEKGSWTEWKEATLKDGKWVYTLDTTDGYPDGDLPARIQAIDGTDKRSSLTELVFTVKNSPPKIELLIPKWLTPEVPGDMELVTGGKLIGMATDLQGVGKGSLKVKFWKDGNPEPDDTNWVVLNENANEKTALEFRYELKDSVGTPLTAGKYHFKITVADMDIVNPKIANYPDETWEGWPPNHAYYDITLIQAKEFPTIKEVEPLKNPPAQDNHYQNSPFAMTALVGHSAGIFDASFTFRKDGKGNTYELTNEGDLTPVTTEYAVPMNNLVSQIIKPGESNTVINVTDPGNPITVTNYQFEDSAYDFTIYAISNEGTESTQTYTVYIDTTGPAVEITRVHPAVGEYPILDGNGDPILDDNGHPITGYEVNGVVTANISANDSNNVAKDEDGNREIRYVITNNPDMADLDAAALYNASDSGSGFYAGNFDSPDLPLVYKDPNSGSGIFVDTTALPEGGPYDFYIIAKDASGNYGMIRSELNVNDDSDKPKYEFTSISRDVVTEAQLWTNDGKANILDTSGKIAGILTDDDAIDVSSIKLRYWKNGADLISGKQEKPLTSSELVVSADKRTVRFELDKTFLGAEDAIYFFEMEFKDSKLVNDSVPSIVSGTSSARNPASTNTGGTTGATRIFIAFDADPPVIEDLQLNGHDLVSTNYADVNFIFTFTAKDANALDKNSSAVGSAQYTGLTITRTSGSISTIITPAIVETDSVKEWAVTVNEAVSNSTYNYEIVLKDVVGKEARKSFTVTVDTLPPDVQITRSPAFVSANDEDNNVNGVIQFTAAAGDDNGLFGVKWFLLPAIASAPGYDTPFPTLATGAGAGGVWTSAPYTARVDTQVDLTDLNAYTLYIIAQDKAGNVNSVENLPDNPATLDLYVNQSTDIPVIKLTNLSPNAVISSGYTLRGTLTDDDGPAPNSLKIEFSSNGTAWDSPISLTPTNIGSGFEYTFEYTMTDTTLSTDGEYFVRVKADDLQVNKPTTGAPGKLDIDKESQKHATTAAIPFVIDTKKPVLTMITPTSIITTAAPVVTGTVTEAHLSSLRVSMDGGNFADGLTPPFTPDASPPDTYSWDYTVADFSTLLEGPHTLTVEALDKVGLNHTLQWVFYKDNAGPDVSFSNINEDDDIDIAGKTETEVKDALALVTGVIVDSNPALRGSFVDEYSPVQTVEAPAAGAYKFQYRFDPSIYSSATWPGESGFENTPWILSAPGAVKGTGKNVSWTIPLSGITEGPHMVQIKAQDVLGNITTTPWIGFKIDTKAPTIDSIVSSLEGRVYTTVDSGNVFTLTGTARDENLSQVTIVLNTGTPVEIPNTSFVQDGAYRKSSWSFPVSKSAFDGLGSDGLYKITIVAEDTAGRSTAVEWEFTKDTTAPEVEFNNMTAEPGFLPMLLDSNPRVLGAVRDTNAIGALTSNIERYNPATTTWVVDTDHTVTIIGGALGQAVVNWSKGPSGTIEDGLYRITIIASDAAKPAANQSSSTPVEFRIDRYNPTVAIETNPSVSTAIKPFYSGNFTVSGTAGDANGIIKVHARIDAGGLYPWASADAAVTVTGNSASWIVTIPTVNPDNAADAMPQGTYTLNVEATDAAGRTGSTFKDFTLDTENPTAAITQPLSLTRVNGEVVIRGTANDNYGVEKIYFKRGVNDTDWTDSLLDTSSYYAGWSGALYSWIYTFNDVNTYANAVNAIEVDPDNRINGIPQPASGTGVWLFPFNVKVVDKAGNEKVTDYYLLLDPLMDVPTINIISPTDGALVGGEVLLSGVAMDDDWVFGVEYRIDPTGTGNNYSIEWVVADTTAASGQNIPWSAKINTDGSLNPAAGTQRHVKIQVRARDSKNSGLSGDLYGDPEVINLYFDSQIPVIEHVKIDRQDGAAPSDYFSGIQVSKTFTVKAEIRDESGIDSIKWRGEGNASYSDNIIDNGNMVIPPTIKYPSNGNLTIGRKYLIVEPGNTNWVPYGAASNAKNTTFIATSTGGAGAGNGYAYEAEGGTLGNDASQNFVYRLNIEVQSNGASSIYKDKTGYYSMNIQAIDNSQYAFQTQTALSIQIDNFYPTGNYTAPYTLTGVYNIRGNARDFGPDSGSIQGLDRVTVYFSRSGVPIPLQEQNVGLLENGSSDPWTPGSHSFNSKSQLVKDMTSTGGGIFKTINTFPADKWSGITIDKNNEVSGALIDADGDGYVEAWFDEQLDKTWYAIFNSRQLKDGPVKLHYVIFDKAGNASYYEKELFIKNNAPKITAVTLGTDIAGTGNIDSRGTKRYTTNFMSTGFTSRNNRLQFKLEKDGGNGATSYRITHVTGSDILASAITIGSVYTIKTPGNTNWVGIGAESNAVGTTFVATSAGDGSGIATGYTQSGTDAVVKTGPFSGSVTADILYNNFTAIPDNNPVYFLIKAWDSTVSGGNEADQLFDMTVVGLRVENNDQQKPSSRLYDLNPHAKNLYDNNVTTTANAGPAELDKNMNKGGLYMTGSGAAAVISGHIEPRGSTAGSTSIFLESGIPSVFSRDTLSGKVILRGYAEDNQRISEIQLSFNGGTPIKIIQTVPATGGLQSAGGAITSWVYDELTLDGHKAEWAYVWDTQTIPGGASLAGTITVLAIARDAHVAAAAYTTAPYALTPNNSNPALQAANAAANAVYNSIQVDTAPYITSITRNAAYSTLRSKQGWFSFRRSSGTDTLEANEEVNINGFNLSTGSGTTVSLKTADSIPLSGQSANRVWLNLPVTAQTGELTLKAGSGSVPAVNNRNDNRNTWNKEETPYQEGSALWNDDRNVHVWQSNNASTGANRGYFARSEKPIHPAMTKNPTDGVLYASWSDYKGSKVWLANNKDNTGTGQSATNGWVFSSFDPSEHTDIHFGSRATIAFNANIQAPGSWALTSAGGMYIWDSQASQKYLTTSTTGNAYVAEGLVHDEMLNQFINQRVVTQGNNIHVSYYDTDTKSLKYWYNTSGTAANSNPTAANYNSNSNITLAGATIPNNRWINIDGGFDGNDIKGNNRVVGWTSGGTSGSNTNSTAARGGSAAAGEYSAIDVTSAGWPVVAYYDITNQTVKLAYSKAIAGGATAPLTAAHWTRQSVFPAGDPNASFAGKYISMRINPSDNRIHIAFSRTSTGDLVYITGTQNGDGSYTFTQSVTVDSVGSVGKWADLSLDSSGNPWISYIDSSRVDSFDGLKMAYCLDPAKRGDPNGWETMNMPTIYNIADARLSIENWNNIGTGTNQQFWSAAIGYASDDYFRIAYYIKP